MSKIQHPRGKNPGRKNGDLVRSPLLRVISGSRDAQNRFGMALVILTNASYCVSAEYPPFMDASNVTHCVIIFVQIDVLTESAIGCIMYS